MRIAIALGLTVALGLAAIAPVSAAAFIARPTEPLACPSGGTTGNLWQGYFHGRKRVDRGWIKYETAAQRYCFKTEKLCRNWLYNMQSEYNDMVWSAECARGRR